MGQYLAVATTIIADAGRNEADAGGDFAVVMDEVVDVLIAGGGSRGRVEGGGRMGEEGVSE